MNIYLEVIRNMYWKLNEIFCFIQDTRTRMINQSGTAHAHSAAASHSRGVFDKMATDANAMNSLWGPRVSLIFSIMKDRTNLVPVSSYRVITTLKYQLSSCFGICSLKINRSSGSSWKKWWQMFVFVCIPFESTFHLKSKMKAVHCQVPE